MSAGCVSVANAPGASVAPFGLVPSPTSDRKTDLSIDRFESRYRRLRKNVITSARLLRDAKQQGGFRHFMAMLTLTYAPGVQWQPNHIPDLQKRIRGWLRYRGHSYGYVWVCELQERGAPHYHILIWIPRGLRLPMADAFGWWPYGSTSIEKVEKPLGYLIKYLSKGKDTIHRFVKGQRTHGSGGLDHNVKQERRWWLAPSYVRKRWPDYRDDVHPAKGGGWVSRVTGEWMPSPWQFVSWHPLTGAVIRWIAGPEIGVFSNLGVNHG
jgi:hypothetical protein